MSERRNRQRLRRLALTAAFTLPACAPGLLPFPEVPAGPETTGARVVKHEQAPGPAGRDSVRFAVVGDVGRLEETSDTEPHPHQKAVAGAIVEACAETCDFTVLLGDNLYEQGIRRRHVREGREALAKIAGGYPAPVYMVLGNHDWGSTFPRHATADRELEWIGSQAQVRGNAHFFDFRAGPVHFWALDTNYLVRRSSAGADPDLADWIGGLAASEARWKIVFGHHNYFGNGNHGNAGSYRDGIRIWRGGAFKDFLERHVLGESDLYLAGHEHNLQFYLPAAVGPQTAATAVVGAGAKCSWERRPANSPRTGNAPALQYQYQGLGFAIVTVEPDRLTIDFYDRAADKLWSARRPLHGAWLLTPRIDSENHCPPR